MRSWGQRLPSLWFVVPAHGRLELAEVCLRALRRSCDAMPSGVQASAVVVADDENLESARALGFATVERENRPLGRKINDGFEAAGRSGVDYVAALGSDDWIDPMLFSLPMPEPGEVRCHRLSAVVSEDRSRLARLRIPYEGGDGVRVFPTALLAPLRFRPAEEDAPRAIDTSIFRNLQRVHRRMPRLVYSDLHALQIVDFKSDGAQLNSYQACLRYREGEELDPWEALADVFPHESLDDMRAISRLAVAA